MAEPLLSVVIAVPEWPNQIVATLDSVAEQTLPDVEVWLKRQETIPHVADADTTEGGCCEWVPRRRADRWSRG